MNISEIEAPVIAYIPKKMCDEIEALILNGYTLKSITECKDEIFVC